MAEAGFALINLENQESFIFQFFPNELSANDRANWTPQETTIGVKPLFYANREPRNLDVRDLYFDNTDTNQTLTPDIKRLRKLMDESTEKNVPPALLAVWGDRNERCVLQDLTIEEVFFNEDGEPTRVRISLGLIEIQADGGETTSVKVVD